MATAYLEKRLKESGKRGIEVSSAGLLLLAGMEATEETKKLLREEGMDLSGHRTRVLTEEDVRAADLIFVMERRHEEYILSKYPYAAKKVYLLKDFKKPGDYDTSENPDIADPIAKDGDFYKATFSIIKESIERILKQIG